MLTCHHQLRAGQTDWQIPEPIQRLRIPGACCADELLGLLAELLEIHIDLLPKELVSAASRKKTETDYSTTVKAGTALRADRRRPSAPPRLYTATAGPARKVGNRRRPSVTNPSSPTGR
jgi:hypothetical protein